MPSRTGSADPGGTSGRSKSTETASIGSGWQSGISSPVRLAAMMPATRATASTSPLGTAPAAMAASVVGCNKTCPAAVASRAVGDLWPTSTIAARPAASTCVSFASAI